MTTYKVGIIGCGRIAGYLEDDPLRVHPCTHVGVYQQHPRCDVVACCSRTRENVDHFGERFAIPYRFTDYHEMLATIPLDIVSVATYAPTHAAITIAAARQQVKAVICEKAMATSLAEADAMIEACRDAGTLLTVNHTRRWGQDYITARDIIERGDIGRLVSLSGVCSGNIVHTGIHMFDCMIYYAGAPVRVWSVLDNDQTERENSGYACSAADERYDDTNGTVMMEFANGVIGQVGSRAKRYFVFELDIMGTDGRIRIGNGVFQLWRRAASTHYTDFFELKQHALGVCPPLPSGLPLLLEDVIGAMEDGHQTRCGGVEARRSLEVVCAAYESHERGGIPVGLPLSDVSRTIVSR